MKLLTIFTAVCIIISFIMTRRREDKTKFLDVLHRDDPVPAYDVILIGLFDNWVPLEKIEKHIGKDSGWKGTGNFSAGRQQRNSLQKKVKN